MNLAICIPISWDFVPTPFLVSLTQLLRPGTLKALRGLGVERYFYLINRAFPLDVNRNTLVKKALELEADWLLFLDADMTFPPDLVPALLQDSIASGAAIVSAAYFKKLPPHPCVSGVFKTPADPQLITPIEPEGEERGAGSEDRGKRGKEMEDTRGPETSPRSSLLAPRSSSLIPCDVIGMGAALVHAAVFDAVPAPWFEYEVYQKTGERTVTEDVPFCRKAKQAGFSILTDPRLVCGHVRQVEIDDSHWRACRTTT